MPNPKFSSNSIVLYSIHTENGLRLHHCMEMAACQWAICLKTIGPQYHNRAHYLQMSLLHCPSMTYSCRPLRLHFPVAHSPRQGSLRSFLAMQGSCPFCSLPITQGIESWIPAHEKGNRVGKNGLKSNLRASSDTTQQQGRSVLEGGTHSVITSQGQWRLGHGETSKGRFKITTWFWKWTSLRQGMPVQFSITSKCLRWISDYQTT